MDIDELDGELSPEMQALVDDTLEKIKCAFRNAAPRLSVAPYGSFSRALLQMKAGKWVTLPSWAHNRRVTMRDGMFIEAWMNFGRVLKEEPLFDPFPLAELQSNKWTLYEGEEA